MEKEGPYYEIRKIPSQKQNFRKRGSAKNKERDRKRQIKRQKLLIIRITISVSDSLPL
jgi:hypothetical protein